MIILDDLPLPNKKPSLSEKRGYRRLTNKGQYLAVFTRAVDPAVNFQDEPRWVEPRRTDKLYFLINRIRRIG